MLHFYWVNIPSKSNVVHFHDFQLTGVFFFKIYFQNSFGLFIIYSVVTISNSCRSFQHFKMLISIWSSGPLNEFGWVQQFFSLLFRESVDAGSTVEQYSWRLTFFLLLSKCWSVCQLSVSRQILSFLVGFIHPMSLFVMFDMSLYI